MEEVVILARYILTYLLVGKGSLVQLGKELDGVLLVNPAVEDNELSPTVGGASNLSRDCSG